jgi:nicotinamide-nucleotide amidase
VTSALDVVGAARDRSRTIATAESLTAGLLASTLAEVPGCSAVLRGGVIAYATDVKEHLLGVDGALLAHVVSGEVAASLAERACAVLAADLGVGTTGVAGPDPLDGQPPGTVWIAVHDTRAGRTSIRRLDLAGDRAAIRVGTVHACLSLMLEVLAAPAGE